MKKQRVNSTHSDETRSATVPPRLSSRLEGRLASYAMAAGAAGVGLLALAPPATADIIYTPANIGIAASQPFDTFQFPIALNGKPVSTIYNPAQLTFTAESFIGAACFAGFPGCAHGASIGVTAPGNGLALGPLARGYQIGPQAHFGGGLGVAGNFGGLNYHASGTGSFGGTRTFTSRSGGPWANKSGYLGVRFLINGNTHYGWVALSAGRGVGTVSGYAYETVANEPIRAGQIAETPEPTTLGLLALGSLGIAAWRRKKAVASDK